MYPSSALSKIRERIGVEIPSHQIWEQLTALEKEGKVVFEGKYRWRRYRLA
jgi:hypothetical protein